MEYSKELGINALKNWVQLLIKWNYTIQNKHYHKIK